MTEASIDERETALPAPRSNRPVTLVHRAEYAMMRALLAFFRVIGVDAASALAGGFMRTVGPLLRPLSKRGETNLRAAFPDWPEARINETIAGVWENLGRTTAEFAHLDALKPFDGSGRVEIAGLDKVEAFKSSGRPHIFVSGHFANWETLPIALKATGFDYAFVYRAANNPLIDALIIEKRAAVMTRTQIPKGKRGGRALIDALKNGKSLALLVDQKLNDGIESVLLGRKAMTAPAAARLSLKFSAPIVPASVARLNGAHLRITVHDPVEFKSSGDVAKDVSELTLLINQALERDIIARPEQWLWLHRRWSRPGER